MNIDDRPMTDDRPLGPFSHFGKKTQMAITLQRVSRSHSCLVLDGVFGDGGSNGAFPVRSSPRWRPAAQKLGNFRVIWDNFTV